MIGMRRMKIAAVGALIFAAAAGAAAAQETLQAVRVQPPGPILSLDAAVWDSASAVTVAMQPQEAALPMNPQPAVPELTVRAAHNGQWLAVLVEWRDPTQSDRIRLGDFDDKVAVEFPIEYHKDDLPSPMMGHDGARVNILQWRAAFQRDVAGSPQTIEMLYPNASIDLYPDTILRNTDALPYAGALGLDNPISRASGNPVLDQMAEGWGTMTVKPDQRGDGFGVWADGRWRVVITLPLASGAGNSPVLAPAGETAVAFAVWEGGAKEVGARKAWSDWLTLTLAP